MNKHPGIIGIKLGMTQLFLADGNVASCTVVQGGCRVVGKRTQDRDGYDALILGIGERKAKHTSKALRTSFEKVGQKPPRLIREMRTTAEYAAGFEIGQDVKLEDVFEEGQIVDVQGQSKGRGFTGVVRHYNMAGATSSHGAHEWTRHGGSIGTTTTPGRVLKNRKMPGQHGNKTKTVLSQRVVKIIPEQQLLLIDGGVPGAPNSPVRVQGAVKKHGGKPSK
jgi:large subunit ribosomal protein L3